MGIWSIFGIQIILGVQERYIFSIYSLGLLENCFLSIQPIKFWKKHKWSDVSSQCILLEALWGFLLFLQYQWYLLWWLNCCAFLQVHLLFCKIQVVFWEMLRDQFLYPLMNFFNTESLSVALVLHKLTKRSFWTQTHKHPRVSDPWAQGLRMCAITYIWPTSDVWINASLYLLFSVLF